MTERNSSTLPLTQGFDVEIKRDPLISGIIIGRNILERVAELTDLSRYTQFVIVTEPQVNNNFGQQLIRGLKTSRPVHVFETKGGEINKTENEADKIVTKLSGLKNLPVDRKTLLLALGGGVVGDMTGYIAGKYLRGVDYFQVPTTFLAMVDASLGGKTAVDHRDFKNMIGLFHLPKAIIMDIVTLETLPDRQFKSGMGELIKHAFLSPELFSRLSKISARSLRANDSELIDLLMLSAHYKMSIVEQDYEEKTGARKVLNFGHTLGHALETAMGLGHYTHGEAISIGMAGAIMISHLEGLLSKEDMNKMLSILKRFGLPIKTSNVDLNLLRQVMSYDKKSIGGKPRFVLLEGIGKPKIDCEVDKKVINRVLQGIF